MRRALVAGLVLSLMATATGSRAAELFRRDETRLEISGSLRELANIGRQTDADDFVEAGDASCLFQASFADCPSFKTVGDKDAWQSLTRLRTRAELQIVDGLRAVVVYDHELLAGVLDTFEAGLGEGFREDDLFDLDWTIADGKRAEWRHLFYRGFVQLEAGGLDLTVGRQRIAWGVGRLWNPIDRFNAIPPLAVQSDQTQGIDSIDARWSFDGFNFLEAVYAPGDSRDEARYALRAHGVVWDTDLSLMGGVFEKAPTVGMDLARNVGDAALRVEVVYTRPRHKVWKIESSRRKRLADFVQLVASIDYTFDVWDGVYVLVEHLYNGNDLGFGSGRAGNLLPLFEATNDRPPGVPAGVSGPFVKPGSTRLFGTSQVVTAAENQTGAMLGTDITPELRIDFLSIYDWNGESAAFFPSLRYSPGGRIEATLGLQTFVGPRRSQYGDAETFAYLLIDFFF